MKDMPGPLPASPFRVIAKPSIAVVPAAGVPGVLIRTALIEPPEFDALQIETSRIGGQPRSLLKPKARLSSRPVP